MQTNIKQIDSVSEFSYRLQDSVITITDTCNGAVRHSFVTAFPAFVEAEGALEELSAAQEANSAQDVAVYDLLDKKVYRIKPHEVDARATLSASFSPVCERIERGDFEIGAEYATATSIHYRGTTLPAGTLAKCEERMSDGWVFALEVEPKTFARLGLTDDGQFMNSKSSQVLVDPPMLVENSIRERKGYLVMSETDGPVYLDADIREGFTFPESVRVQPVFSYLGGEKVLDIVFLNNTCSH